MGIQLETWRARIGTFVQRPRLKTSMSAMHRDRGAVKIDRGAVKINNETVKIDRETVTVESKTVTSLLWLTLLLCFCLHVSSVNGAAQQLNVRTLYSLKWQQQLKNTWTWNSENWDLVGDESSLAGCNEYAFHSRLLLLSGDIEVNPGPPPVKGAAATGVGARPKIRDGHQKGENLLMSEEDIDILDTQRVHLQDNIDLEDGLLLAHIRSRGGITRRNEDEIRAQGANASQVGRLLDLLQKRDCDTMDKFIHSLQATGKSLVITNWLRPARHPDSWNPTTGTDDTEDEGATNLLSKADRDMIEQSRPTLMSSLTLAEDVLGMLRAREVLTPDEESLIKETKPNSGAVGKLTNYILCKSSDSLEQFLHTLKIFSPTLLVSHLRQPTTEDTFKGPTVMGGSSTSELQVAIRNNLKDKLKEWKTELEIDVSDGPEYVDQPCQVNNKQYDNTIEWIETSRPGDRLVIYGEAGMGKTTLLRQLARSWIEGGASKFTYVFLIPLRYVGQGTLLNIICDELRFVPASSFKNLKRSLELWEPTVLYLLDSFEELRKDVADARDTEIKSLIEGKRFPNSTVVVTSRPGSTMPQSGRQTTAQLKDLHENKVKEIISQYFDTNEAAAEAALDSFPALSFLQRPINLALFLYVARKRNQEGLAQLVSQVELLNQVLQYLMLAWAKKKHSTSFKVEPGSYIGNKDIPRDIKRLFKAIAEKCYQQRKENNVMGLLHIEDADELQEYLDVGLFTEGTVANTVSLPHRLFVEYFTAAHLAENPDSWKVLFDEIQQRSESKSPRARPSLTGVVVRRMGLENVLKFVVALSPQPQLDQVCRQVGSLFVLERRTIGGCYNYRLAKFEEYYTELIRDCCDESGKRLLATALLGAPVRDVTHRYWGEKDRSHVLLSYLDYKQNVRLLKKIHNISLSVIDGKSTLSCTGGNKRLGLGIGDRFVVALVYCHDCIIKADELYIRGEYRGRRLDLPASVLTRMSGVRRLRLTQCTLCKGLPDYMSDIDISAASLHSSPCPTNSSLERVELDEVKGLEHCDVITSRQCQLVMVACGDVRVSSLKTWFPRVSELELGRQTTVVYETEEELTLWLSTILTVRVVGLAPQHEEESLSLCHLLNILAEKELEYLLLHRSTTLLYDVRDTSATVKQNNTLSQLRLEDCKGDVDLGQLLEVCSRQCPRLKTVSVHNSKLVFDDERVESVKQLSGLRKFWLYASAIHTPAGRSLSEQEAEQLLYRLCPSAEIVVWYYPESESASGSGTKD